MGASARRKNQPSRTRKLKTEIAVLEEKLDHTLRSLNMASVQLRAIEHEVEIFLTDYYRRVGRYFEQLEMLDRELETMRTREHPIQPPALHITSRIVEQTNQSIQLRHSTIEIDRELKTIYRSMAKEFHPDVTVEKKSKKAPSEEIIKQVNEAYSQKNLGELWRLRFELQERELLTTRNLEQRRDALRVRVQEAEVAVRDVNNRRLKIENSPACALLEKSVEAQLCGKDFADQVIADVVRQIEQRKRDLLNAKLQSLYEEAREVRAQV